MKESRVQLKRVGFPFKKHVKTQNKFWGVRNMISENLFSVFITALSICMWGNDNAEG